MCVHFYNLFRSLAQGWAPTVHPSCGQKAEKGGPLRPGVRDQPGQLQTPDSKHKLTCRECKSTLGFLCSSRPL